MKKILIILSFSLLAVFPLLSFAQVNKPFGGKSTFMTPCTCDATFMITISDAASFGAPTNFIYNPLSTTLLGYMLIMTPGANTLGLASSLPAQCMVTNPGSGCVTAGFGYPMTMVGTSIVDPI
jgi:hypothetical protein